jgi:hypothetical protein
MLGLAATASSTTPPRGFTTQETLSVPVDGSTIISATTLQAGKSYLLRATGTFTIATPPCPLADAEFARFETNNTCVLPGTPQDFVGAYDVGVGINSPIANNNKGITWATTFNPTHQYTVSFAGLGAPINVNYHDTLYSDNSGSLTLEIFAPLPITQRQIPTLTEWGLLALLSVVMASGFWMLRRRR